MEVLKMYSFIWRTIIVFSSVINIFVLTQQTQQQVCPQGNEIAPCVCTVKKNGLDILCEATDLQHISSAMSVLKGRSPIIFYLKLRHNNLPKLQGFVFLALDIRHLTIHNSSLAAIEETALSSLGKGLTQLDISQNQLSKVPTIAIKHLYQLLILNLNHNKIGQIHKKAFEGLESLEILTLYENKINLIEDEAFRGLEKKLKRLNIGGNDLTSIPRNALCILETLKKLEIQENKITEISSGDFEGLKHLDSLILAHNRLSRIPSKVFNHLSQLNSLELEGNQIVYIDPEAFFGLEENLQYLRLGDNNIHAIPSEALRPLHRLRHLDLRANNITSISEDAFSGYGDSLTFLNLQKNEIKVLPGLIFENLNSLESLNLQNNKLDRIPEDIVEPLLDTLKIVDITDNPLICSCDLTWFRQLLEDLKDRDDEMQQKKKPMCTMVNEGREYYVQMMPEERMDCFGKNLGRAAFSKGNMQITQIYIFYKQPIFLYPAYLVFRNILNFYGRI
ncbi:leucine-rich repeat-containing protein 15 [Condylostylus longicornis]|uniref:leucine-rich repeat-containing protein 15 n=1 Tax=Condylostylus longicornis TaxID=2530218 RepID=UPI00244DA2CF|nr:leucine-rich repeat-containing protein 15 [Condylostylus longicornis]XP_055374409.1 leucine-rich repeat-containing protein 15 [Condylostylus longicornis]XP_055374410.1 leucine-rich repeat-containing protein 15 [Condylostylus longicornis]